MLKNTRIYAFSKDQKIKINTQEFMEKVYWLANQFYTGVDNAKIIISGDGANWIRQSSSYWPGSDYILDKFHAFRNIGHVFSVKNDVNRAIYNETSNLLSAGNFGDLMLLLKQNWFDEDNKKRKLKKLISYFELNEKEAKGISNQNNKYNIGCDIEGAISHNIKGLLGYGAKAFSKAVFTKMLNIRMAKMSGISLVQMLKENICEAKKQKEKFFRHSYWQKNTFDNRYDLPITKNGSKSGRWVKNFSTIF